MSWKEEEDLCKTRVYNTNVSLVQICSFVTDTADAPGDLHVLGHDGDAFGVDCAEVGILEKTRQEGLGSLLEGQDGRGLEPQIGLKLPGNLLGDLAHKPLERELADEEIGRLLILTDLTQGDGSRPVPVRLLYPANSRSGLSSCLGGKLLPRALASGGCLPGCLFRASHLFESIKVWEPCVLIPDVIALYPLQAGNEQIGRVTEITT